MVFSRTLLEMGVLRNGGYRIRFQEDDVLWLVVSTPLKNLSQWEG